MADFLPSCKTVSMTTVDAGAAVKAIPSDTFAARLKLARHHAGNLTYSQAAERCGLSRENWANWERGKLPRDKVEVAEQISEGLRVDLDWLLHGGPLTKEERPGRVLGRRLTASYPTRGNGTSPLQPAVHTASAARRPHHSPDRPPSRPNQQRVDRPVRLDRPDTRKRPQRRSGDDVL